MDLEKEDRILTHFLESIGRWRNHIVICGGYAPIIYMLYETDIGLGLEDILSCKIYAKYAK